MGNNWWWSAHTHSKHSMTDALSDVWAPDKQGWDLVGVAADLGYPALGLTDHGNMAGTVALYKGCRKKGIEPLPGIEAYTTFSATAKRPETFHMTMWATSEVGYTNLVRINNRAVESFKYKPLVAFDDLAEAAAEGALNGIAVGTGCVSGIGPSLLRNPEADVVNVLSALASWFNGKVYVELMDHGLEFPGHTDAALNQHMIALADRVGLACILTQDSHYCLPADREQHDTYKKLYSWKEDVEDAVFGGTSGYHMTSQLEMEQRIPTDVVDKGKEGLVDLLNSAKVVIPALDDFVFRVPSVSVTVPAEDELVYKVHTNAELKHNGSPPERYKQRTKDELEMIVDYGFNEYMLLVSLITDWMRSEKILFNTRGSACGSLVAWYLGITEVDPIKYGIPFDRFISPDRGKPPDIDLDLPDDDRARVLEWVRSNWHTVHIANWIEAKLSSDDETKGSLVVKWRMAEKKRGNANPKPDDDTLVTLRKLAAHAPYTHIGVNPAGVILANDMADLADLPLMRVSSSQMTVSAFDKYAVEETGLLKMDLLGLKTLRAMRITRDICGVELDDIPLNDPKVFSRLRQGKVDGVFQLQGFTGEKVLKRVKPTRLSDLVAAVALGRPAIMGVSLDDYIERKHKEQPIPKSHQIIEEATKDTYGIMLFQEQVVTVLRGLGFTPIELARALKAIKASNAAVGSAAEELERLKERVDTLAIEVGMTDQDRRWLTDAFTRYAGYSFNKAHSVSYGLMAYKSAWYATHHTVAFWTGALTAFTGDKEKELKYKRAARADDIKLFRPHVNKSGVGYTADVERRAIRYGLMAIEGVGEKTAVELVTKAPYTSLEDMAKRVDARKVTGAKGLRQGHSIEACGGVVKQLAEFGALEGLT